MDGREQFKAVYRTLMAAVTLAFLVAAFFAIYHSTVGNGLMLVGGMLIVMAIIVGLSINKHDDSDDRLVRSFEQLNTLRSENPVQFALGDVLARGGRTIEFSAAEPEIHSIGMEKVEFARQLAARGAPIDEICQLVDPAFCDRDPLYQQAVRKLVDAILKGEGPQTSRTA